MAPPWRRMGPRRHSASSGRCSETHRVGSLGSLWELTLWSVRFAVSCRPGMQVARDGLCVSGTWSLCSAFSRSRSRHIGNHTAAMMGSGGQSPTPSWACSATSRLAAGSEINAGGLPPHCTGSRQRAGFKVREELASGHNCHLPTSSLPPGLALLGPLEGDLCPEQLPPVSLKEALGQLGAGWRALGRQGAGPGFCLLLILS